MNTTAKFPLDLTELSQFRALKEPLGGTEATLYFFWLLWRDLAQLAGEGLPLGRMRPANVQAFAGLLVDQGKFPDGAVAMEFLKRHVIADAETPNRLLIPDGEEVTCPRFINLNPDLIKTARENKGGHGRSYSIKMQKFEKTLMQEGLKLPSDVFVDAEGAPLATETIMRVQRLIVSSDNALKQHRPPIGWRESVVSLALQVIGKHSDEDIRYICRKVAANYDHPLIQGTTTERLLPKFGTIIGDLGEQ